MKYTVTQATLEDCLELAPKLRQSDIQEIWSSNRYTPTEALVESREASGKHAYTLNLDGIPVGMFGVAPLTSTSTTSDIGVVWLLGADNMTSYKKGFYKVSIKYLQLFLDMYKTVFNYVDERNTISSKWLESLGFKSYHRDATYGIDKIPFNLYIKGIYV